MWIGVKPLLLHTVYTHIMATGANAIQHRIVALLCLFAVLFIAIPYAICAPTNSHAMANMPASHCDPCCPVSTSATAACCLAHPQPSVPAPQPVSPIALDVASDPPGVPQPALFTTTALRVNSFRTPPPPLITNLRI